jgi:hypothetical protein
MARTIVYKTRKKSKALARLSTEAADRNIRISTTGQPKGDENNDVRTKQEPDKFPDKLAKYIPAEMLAFFLPFSAAGQERGILIAALVAGCIVTPGYLFITAKKNNPDQMPRFYYYILASVAFAVWAQATSDLGCIVGLSKTWSSFLLTGGVLLIPGVDELVTVLTNDKKS